MQATFCASRGQLPRPLDITCQLFRQATFPAIECRIKTYTPRHSNWRTRCAPVYLSYAEREGFFCEQYPAELLGLCHVHHVPTDDMWPWGPRSVECWRAATPLPGGMFGDHVEDDRKPAGNVSPLWAWFKNPGVGMNNQRSVLPAFALRCHFMWGFSRRRNGQATATQRMDGLVDITPVPYKHDRHSIVYEYLGTTLNIASP